MRPIAIFGTGGFAREVLCLLEDLNRVQPRWQVRGFLDDREETWGTQVCGLPVLGGRDWLAGAGREADLAFGVGSPGVKRALFQELALPAGRYPSLVHPSAVLSSRVQLGAGVVITAGCILTTEIQVHDFAMLNLHVTVGHDCTVGPYVTVSPGVNVSGNVHLGEGCDVGTGSKIIQGVSIGEWSVVGAGAVVARDLPANCTAVGVPAKVIKERAPGWHLQGRHG